MRKAPSVLVIALCLWSGWAPGASAAKWPRNWAAAPYWVPTSEVVRQHGSGAEGLPTAPMPFFALQP